MCTGRSGMATTDYTRSAVCAIALTTRSAYARRCTNATPWLGMMVVEAAVPAVTAATPSARACVVRMCDAACSVVT